jgi:hypothetical protein
MDASRGTSPPPRHGTATRHTSIQSLQRKLGRICLAIEPTLPSSLPLWIQYTSKGSSLKLRFNIPRVQAAKRNFPGC